MDGRTTGFYPVLCLFVLTLAFAGSGPASAGSCEALGGGPLDLDRDGFGPTADCDDADPSVWAVPGDVADLRLDGGVLSWQPTGDPGGAGVTYTVHRSGAAADFTGPTAVCIDPFGLDLQASDPDVPPAGAVFFYLVGAANDCGEGSLGLDSGGSPRVALPCDCSVICDDANACTADTCSDGQCVHDVMPPVVLRQPQSVADCAGGETRFSVLAQGTAGLGYQWFVNGVPAGSNSPELTLSGLTPADDGAQVFCEITDACQTAASEVAVLTVFVDPASCQGGNDGLEAPNMASIMQWVNQWTHGRGKRENATLEMLDSSGRPTTKNAGQVYLHSGEFHLTEVDLRVNGRGFDFVWARKYRSRVDTSSAMGVQWDFSYNLYVEPSGPDLILHSGDTRADLYLPAVMPDCWAAEGFFRDLCRQPDTSYTLTFPDRRVWSFHPLDGSPWEGRISEITDSNGNSMAFAYDGLGQLATITDTLGRPYTIVHDANGFIESVTDLTGRTVSYEHYLAGESGGSFGDLRSVTTPAVIGTVTGNDFPQGKTTVYTYTEDRIEPALNRNLLTITDPEGQTYLENVYTTAAFPALPRFDRLDRQILPNGVIGYVYVPQVPDPGNNFSVSKTIVNDRMGNVTESFFDALHRVVLHREYTGRADPLLPTDDSSNRPTGQLRATDPAFFETRHEYNLDYLLTRTLFPEGNETQHTYDSGNPDVRLRANLLQTVYDPGPRGGDQTQIVHGFGYNPDFGTIPPGTVAINHHSGDDYERNYGFRIDISPGPSADSATGAWESIRGGGIRLHETEPTRGTDKFKTHTPGIAEWEEIALVGAVSPTSKSFVDRFKVELSDDITSVTPITARFPKVESADARGHGYRVYAPWTSFTDGKGLVYTRLLDPDGNVTRRERPQVTTGVLGGGSQTIVDTWDFNGFGQVIRHTRPDGRVDEFGYHDLGCMTGYLRERRIDAPGFDLTTTYEYDCLGRLIREIDPRAHDTLYDYNALDQVVRQTSREVTDGSGVRYTRDVHYDANDLVVRLEIENVDDQGNLEANDHLSRALDHDALDRFVRVTWEVDETSCVVNERDYDGNDNVALVRLGEATNGNQPTNQLQILYDERDLVYRTIRAPGDASVSTKQLDYDRNGNAVRLLTGLEDPAGPEIGTGTYDGYDRRVLEIDAEGNEVVTEYDANDNVVSLVRNGELVDGLGGVNVRLYEVSIEHDEINRLTAATVEFFDPDTGAPLTDGTSVNRTHYNQRSQLLRVEDDNLNGIDYTYDSASRLSTTTDARGNSVQFVYDANSNVTLIVEDELSDLGGPPQSFLTTYAFDNLDRVVRETDNAANQHDFAHDSRDNTTLHIDALQNVTRVDYDGLDRPIREEIELTDTGDGMGVVIGAITTTESWDDSSRLVARTDDNGNTTSYVYDALDRLVLTGYADGTTRSSGYDVHDNVVSLVDPNGSTCSSTYDRLNRLTGKTIAPGPGILGTTFEIYRHDGLSRLVHAEDDDSVVTYVYDSMDNIVREDLSYGGGPAQSVQSTHDGVSNRLTTIYPTGRQITRTYDVLDRVRTVADLVGTIATYDYLGPYRVQRRTFGNNTRADYEYDADRRVTRTNHTAFGGALPIDDRGYIWDGMDNKRAIFGDVNATFSYDSDYRMTQSARGATIVDYTFDGVGNRTSVSGGSSPGAYTMDPSVPVPADLQMNQYTATPFDSRQSDENGNLALAIAGPAQRQLSFDYRDRLVRVVELPSGFTTDYAYDALDRRVRKSVSGPVPETTRYLYDGWEAIEEQDDLGTPLVTYVFGPRLDELLSMSESSDINGNLALDEYAFHANDLGSIVAATDGFGDVVERYSYTDYGEPEVTDPFGAPLPGSAIGNPYLFTGRRFDPETGWYYFRMRYLDPRAGRFVTRDPIGVWGDDANLGNGYAYVGNNPVSFLDPLGLQEGPGKKNDGVLEEAVKSAASAAFHTLANVPGDVRTLKDSLDVVAENAPTIVETRWTMHTTKDLPDLSPWTIFKEGILDKKPAPKPAPKKTGVEKSLPAILMVLALSLLLAHRATRRRT